jgi:hypothetical protein
MRSIELELASPHAEPALVRRRVRPPEPDTIDSVACSRLIAVVVASVGCSLADRSQGRPFVG